MELTVEVEKASNILRKLTIQVPSKEVEARFEKSLAEVQRTAKVKGFRPGMVPITMVKQMYGADVRHQLFHSLIEESYRSALQEKKIKAVGSPKIETPKHQTGEGSHDHSLKEGQDLTYTATVEVLPEIEVKSYSGFSFTKAKAVVNEGDVEIVIKNMLESQAQLIPASSGLVGADGSSSSRPARKGDFVDMEFNGGLVTENGVEEKAGMKGSRMLELGSNSLIPGFEEQLEGLRAGDSKTFRIPFPKDFYEAEMAGKDAEFRVHVKEIKEKKLPELNDEFAKGLGYDNLPDMRTKAKEHLIREKQDEVERKLRSDLLQMLIDKNAFDCPQALIQAQTRMLAQEVAGNLKNQGFNDQMIQEALGSELENLKKKAETQVRASLILEAISDKEGVHVTPAEIDAELVKMAENMKMDLAKVQEYYQQNPNRKADLEYRIREDRTIQLILNKAKIKEEK